MARNVIISRGEYYHIYNRGTEKRNIFLSKQDYERFLSLLYLCNSNAPVLLRRQGRTLAEVKKIERSKPLVDISAFCLMPNHFHLIIYEREQGGISRFIQKLTTGYTMYFNKVHERTGVLFQGKYKASHIATDKYLKHLISYIHLNPVKLVDPEWKEKGVENPKSTKEYLKSYRYSSHQDYLKENRIENIIINQNDLPKYFSSPEEYDAEVSKWLD